jgi:hypothetical protein
VDVGQVPPELAQQKFPLDPIVLSREFNALGDANEQCYSRPGPADPTLYCAQSSINGYWVGYRWYKFVDQPALQRAKLSDASKVYMQQRVETLHGMIGRISRWLKPGEVPTGSELAHIDPVALVTPPEGLERGYVPIGMWESPHKPPGCKKV